MTAREIVKRANVSDKYPLAYITPEIETFEQDVAELYLGYDFYCAVLEDRIEYNDLTEWKPQQTYQLEDRVLYGDTPLVSLKNNNGIEPCEDKKQEWWKPLELFKTPCIATLYDRHLAGVLTYYILPQTFTSATYQAGAKGLEESYSEGSSSSVKTVTRAGFDRTITDYENKFHIRLRNMTNYIRRNQGACSVFQKYLPLQKMGCGQPTKQTQRPRSGRKFYFKR